MIDETFLTAEETFNNIRIHYEKGLLKPKEIGDYMSLRKTGNIYHNTYCFDNYIKLR